MFHLTFFLLNYLHKQDKIGLHPNSPWQDHPIQKICCQATNILVSKPNQSLFNQISILLFLSTLRRGTETECYFWLFTNRVTLFLFIKKNIYTR